MASDAAWAAAVPEWLAVFGAPSHTAEHDVAPTTLKQVLDAALALGAAVGRLGEAMRVVGDIEGRLAFLGASLDLDRRSNLVAGVPAPGVVIATAMDDSRLTLPGLWVPGIAATAGLQTLGVAEGEPDAWVEWKDLDRLAPDAVVYVDTAVRPVDASRLAREVIDSGVSAARHASLHVIDGRRSVFSPGPNLARSAELLAFAVHGRRAGVTAGRDEVVSWNAGLAQ